MCIAIFRLVSSLNGIEDYYDFLKEGLLETITEN